ncbi:PAS domain S-box protein [Haloprofundus halophilus]|uniref:PAS domain S-box protein n=1 Tax=Haloprofundus halophilus TaxID=2283527 RepID=UPI000E43B799|nr:bacterio-opsin activator domain-containing protein [Haloprofundus halophilus]
MPDSLTESLRETLDLFDGSGEPRTTPEVADLLDLGRRSTYERLERLVEHGELETKKVGANARVWWLPPSASVDHSLDTRRDHERFASLVEAVEAYAIFVLDPEGRVRTWNRGAARIEGYDAHEVVGEHVSTFYTETERDARVPEEHLSIAAETGLLEDDGWRVRSDGSRFWASVTIAAVRDDGGELEGYVTVVRETTGREEREVEKSEQRYRTLAENFPNGAVALLDEELRHTLVEGRGFEKLDFSAADLRRKRVQDVYSEELLEVVEPNYRAALEGESNSFELEVQGRTFAFQTLPLTTDDGDVFAAMATSQDVTERKEYEQTIRDAKSRLQAATEAGAVGTFEWYIPEDRVVVGPSFADQFGVDPDLAQEGVSSDLFVAAIHEDDRERIVRKVEEAVASCGEHKEEYRVRNADGELRWVAARGHVECDDDGDPVVFLGALVDITERKQAEIALEKQRHQLAALNDLNAIIRDITDTVIDQPTREKIEATVCERLADVDSYEFAWIGDVDAASQAVKVRAEAGVEGYLDEVPISVDPDDSTGRGPAGKAVRTGEIRVLQDALSDPDFEPWRHFAEQYGYRSCAAIPLVHDGNLYGLLAIYADRPKAFDGQEREVIAQLGEVVGHAIAAIERKQALMSDEITEIQFIIPSILETFGVDFDVDGTITFEQTTTIGDDDFLQYGTVDATAIDVVKGLTEQIPHFTDMTVVDRETDTNWFELQVSEPPVVSAVASHGGHVKQMKVEDGDCHMTIHLPTSVAARSIIDTVRGTYPTAKMASRRQITRDDDSLERVHRLVTEDLTERQRTALEAAVYAGYFAWPRERTGERIAESIGIASPTFHQHLRKAQQKVFGSLFATPASGQ